MLQLPCLEDACPGAPRLQRLYFQVDGNCLATASIQYWYIQARIEIAGADGHIGDAYASHYRMPCECEALCRVAVFWSVLMILRFFSDDWPCCEAHSKSYVGRMASPSSASMPALCIGHRSHTNSRSRLSYKPRLPAAQQ